MRLRNCREGWRRVAVLLSLVVFAATVEDCVARRIDRPSGDAAVRLAPIEEKSRVRVDLFGDPLPQGAVSRLGSVRFRGDGVLGTLDVSERLGIVASSYGHRYANVALWDLHSGRKIGELRSDRTPSPVRAVRFVQDSTHLVVARDDGALESWSVDSRRLRSRTQLPIGASDIASSPVENLIAAVGWASGTTWDVILWDAVTGRMVNRIRGTEGGRVRAVRFSNDGKRVGVATGLGVVSVWATKSGEIVRTVNIRSEIGLEDRVRFSEDLAMLGVLSRGSLSLYDTESGQQAVVPLPEEDILSFEFSGLSGGLVLGMNSGFTLVNKGPAGRYSHRKVRIDGSVYAMVLSREGRFLVCGVGGGRIRVFRFPSMKEHVVLHGHSSSVTGIVPLTDKRVLLTSSEDGGLRLWDWCSGLQLSRLPVPEGAEIMNFTVARNTGVGVFAMEGGRIGVLNIRSGSLASIQLPANELPWKVLASKESPFLVTVSQKGMGLALWKYSEGAMRRVNLAGAETIDGVGLPPDGLALDGQGRTFLAGEGRVLKVWALSTGALRRTVCVQGGTEDSSIRSVATDGSGTKVAMALYDGRVYVLSDVGSGKPEYVTTVGESPTVGEFPRVAMSEDGTLLAIGGFRSIIVYSLSKERARLIEHRTSSRPTCLRFLPGGRYLAVGSENGIIEIYRVSNPSGRLRRGRGQNNDILTADPELLHGMATCNDRLGSLVVECERGCLEALRNLSAEYDRAIRDLGNPEPTVREEAFSALLATGKARLVVEDALGEQSGDPEIQERLFVILQHYQRRSPPESELRLFRCIVLLEHIGTTAAMNALRRIALVAPRNSFVERAANEALVRIRVKGRVSVRSE